MDMLDTDIYVPEIVNLMFFKPVPPTAGCTEGLETLELRHPLVCARIGCR
ncbi:hypothetical protein G9444_6280 [Rhodococcus erythropolis]|uniref:Uncharacterized protein n=1 Tax=Rhodococcus erythropolis TaxID=1833 RepID=A0A6G9D2L4_RHOER|nr:hypothetical protein G9444_6280 [Rhodococcus erythropolis]